MKRISLLPFLLIICLLFSACSANNNQQVQHGLPPRYTIRSVDDFNTIINAPNLSDKEMDAFLARESIRRTLLETKEDVNALASDILSTIFPVVSDSIIPQCFEFAYFQGERNDFYFNIEGIRYRFQCCRDDTKYERFGKPTACYELDGEILELYRIEGHLHGNLYVDGYRITVMVSNYTSIDQISFEYFTLYHPDGGEPNS